MVYQKLLLYGYGVFFGVTAKGCDFSFAKYFDTNKFLNEPGAYISNMLQQHSNLEISPSFNSKSFKKFILGEIFNISEDVAVFRFLLNNQDEVFNLPTCSTLQFQYSRGAHAVEKVRRSYTPITPNGMVKGYFDIIVKKQPKGRMTEALFGLSPGDMIECRSLPIKLKYIPNKWCHVDLIAGGTGITPILQIIHAALDREIKSNQCYYKNEAVSYGELQLSNKLMLAYNLLKCNGNAKFDKINDNDRLELCKKIKKNNQKATQSERKDTTILSLLYTNQTFDKILLKSVLDNLQRNSNGRFKASYVVSREKSKDVWVYDRSISIGHINSTMINKYLHPPHYCECYLDKDGNEVKTMYCTKTHTQIGDPHINHNISVNQNTPNNNVPLKRKHPIVCVCGPDQLVQKLTGVPLATLKQMSGGHAQQPVSSSINNLSCISGVLGDLGFSTHQVYRF